METELEIVGVPMDLGADRRGVDMGPSAIRYAGLDEMFERIGRHCTDGGDLVVPRPEERDPDADPAYGNKAKYLAETRTVCERLAERLGEIRAKDRLPVVLGGDHSIAIGTANGCATTSTGILWFDAHSDFNTPETTPSGNVHGMPLAALLGEGEFANHDWTTASHVQESNVAIVGLRSVDETEKPLLQDSDVSTYTMSDIDSRGISEVVEEAISVATEGVEQLYVSFDLDVLDPDEAPGVGTPVRGGMSYREAHAALELLHAQAEADLCAFEMVEVNPILDRHNRTAELACELAASAFGDRIL
jgi:arginase